ncbi:MAG: hypothetical protein ABI846_05000 [Rudaea sp.]
MKQAAFRDIVERRSFGDLHAIFENRETSPPPRGPRCERASRRRAGRQPAPQCAGLNAIRSSMIADAPRFSCTVMRASREAHTRPFNTRRRQNP